jgi:hypothetical protein
MSTVIERRTDAPTDEQVPIDGLFQVWIDLGMGDGPSDWWWNSPPQPLGNALDEAAHVRSGGWVCKVMPEGQNPRPDGRWDNP